MVVTILENRLPSVVFVIALLCCQTDAVIDGDDDTREIHTSNSDLCKYLYGRKNFLEFNERCDTTSPLVVGPFEGRSSSDSGKYYDGVQYDISPKFKAMLDRERQQGNFDNFEDSHPEAGHPSSANLPYLVDLLKMTHLLRTLEKEDSDVEKQKYQARYIIPRYDEMREEPFYPKHPFMRAFGKDREAIGAKNRRDHEENHPLYLI